MTDNNNSRSGLQAAANLAYAAKAAYRIIQAAAVSGAYGAAAVAVKEALPFLVKILVGTAVCQRQSAADGFWLTCCAAIGMSCAVCQDFVPTMVTGRYPAPTVS